MNDRPRRVKVLHLIDHLSWGGAQEIVLELARGLDPSRFEVQVWALHGHGAYFFELQSAGIAVKSLSRWKFNPLIPIRLWRWLSQDRWDILHLHLSFSTLLGGLIGRLSGVPSILVTLHALQNQSAPWIFPLWKLLAPIYDKFIVQVNLALDEMNRIGFPPDKILLIPLGVRMTDASQESPDRAPPCEGNFVLLNIARLHPHKGQIYLIRAMAKVVREFPLAQLWIVGDGPRRRELQREIRRLGLEDVVVLISARRDLDFLYSNCDIFVLPSVREGLGLVTIQAMAHGKPVIASNVGAVSEAVKPDRTGLLVPPRDPDALARAIVDLLRDPERRKRLGDQARKFARERFGLEQMLRKYVDLYSQIVDACHVQ